MGGYVVFFFSDHKKTPVLRPIQNKVWGRFLPLYDSSAGKVKAFNQHYDYEGFVSGDCQICMAQFCSFYPLIYLKQPLQLLNYQLETLKQQNQAILGPPFWKKYVTFVHTNAWNAWWLGRFHDETFQVQICWSKHFLPRRRSSWAKGRVGLSPLGLKKAIFLLGGYLGGVLKNMGGQTCPCEFCEPQEQVLFFLTEKNKTEWRETCMFWTVQESWGRVLWKEFGFQAASSQVLMLGLFVSGSICLHLMATWKPKAKQFLNG